MHHSIALKHWLLQSDEILVRDSQILDSDSLLMKTVSRKGCSGLNGGIKPRDKEGKLGCGLAVGDSRAVFRGMSRVLTAGTAARTAGNGCCVGLGWQRKGVFGLAVDANRGVWLCRKHHKDAFGLREAPRGAFGVAVTP
ncbi:hypothetical protein Tco_1439560 [Tanacetum coccineum]